MMSDPDDGTEHYNPKLSIRPSDKWQAVDPLNDAGTDTNDAGTDTPGNTQNSRTGKVGDFGSIHGDTAARRRAITELLFFASVGDLRRCKRIVRLWNLKASWRHLSASEGAYQVTEWLLSEGCDVNMLDRFKRTALEDAVRGEFREVAKLLTDNGGKVFEEGGLVELESSKLAHAFGYVPQKMFDFDPDWELDPTSLTVLEKLGEGEFGVVHKARWYGTLVAAKILKGSSEIALGDFRGEIEILRRVHHPNAVQFLGACTRKEPYILVTELMTAGSLADAFRRPEVFPMRRAVEIALDAARGLAYLHNRKPNPIIHRDLKPGNLMLSGSQYQDQAQVVFDTGTVKLADFGLSKTLPVNRHAEYGYLDSKFRLTGETGSYRYMAPEVFRHEPYNSRVDVYSFSMIVYQLFEFQPPFSGQDPVEAARQAALYERRPQFVALLQPHPFKKEIRALIARCWAADPEDRPTFVEIAEELERILSKMPRPQMVKHPGGGSGGGGGCCSVG
eukprot:scaffold27.g6013.t1